MNFVRNLNPKDALGVGSIKGISPKIVETILKIHDRYPEVVFCGSLGLVANGLIDREIKDLDILTPEDHYRDGGFLSDIILGPNKYGRIGGSYRVKSADGVRITHFAVSVNDIVVDVFYKECPLKYNEKGFYGRKIKIEDPEGAIQTKLSYLEKPLKHDTYVKHLMDLLKIGVPHETIYKHVEKSRSKTDDSIPDFPI